MSRNNDVFKVLVTKGNHPMLPKGKTISDLLPGQIGVFDMNNKSIQKPTTKFYFAVGIDRNGDGIIDDIIKSSGSYINKKYEFYKDFKLYQKSSPMKVVLKDYTAECETEYGIKLEFRNSEIYRTQGFSQFTKSYIVKTSCCNNCEPTCPSGDSNEITKLLLKEINNDTDGLVIAKAIPRGDISASGVTPSSEGLTLENLEAMMAYNKTQTDTSKYVYSDIEITSVTQKTNSFHGINLKYSYPRQTVVVPSKIEGFRCNGKVEVTQYPTFEQGSGYDIQQLEYYTNGWDDSPYRLSTLNGVANIPELNADKDTKYNQIVLAYDQYSQGAWLEYLNNQSTIIAIPKDDVATLDDIAKSLGLAVGP